MSLWDGLRNSFITGLVLVAPLAITLYVLQLLSGVAFQLIDPVVDGAGLESYTADNDLAARMIAGVLILITVTVLGFLGQRESGQRLFGELGRPVALVPVVRTIYSTVHQISASFSSTETSYDSLVLVEFPRKGLYSVGLVTSESPESVDDVTGTATYNVFLPSSPSPASGRLILVSKDEVHEVDLSVNEGLSLVMTTGASSSGANSVPAPVDASPQEVVKSLERGRESSSYAAAESGTDRRDDERASEGDGLAQSNRGRADDESTQREDGAARSDRGRGDDERASRTDGMDESDGHHTAHSRSDEEA